MSLVCSWNELGMSYVQVSSSPFCTRPFWRIPTLNGRRKVLKIEIAASEVSRGRFGGDCCISTSIGQNVLGTDGTFPRDKVDTSTRHGMVAVQKWGCPRRTNVQQLTCKIDLPFSFYYRFFSFVLFELKPFVFDGESPGGKLMKKCQKV